MSKKPLMLHGKCYLVLQESRRHGELLVTGKTTRMPDLKSNQLAVRVDVSIDSSAFQVNTPTAALTIPASAVVRPPVEVTLATAEGAS